MENVPLPQVEVDEILGRLERIESILLRMAREDEGRGVNPTRTPAQMLRDREKYGKETLRKG